MKARVLETKESIKGQASKLEKALASFETQKTEKTAQIDDYFDRLLVKVAEARENIKAEFNDLCESKNSQLSICITEYKKYMAKLDASKLKVDKLSLEMRRGLSLQNRSSTLTRRPKPRLLSKKSRRSKKKLPWSTK